MKVSLVQTSVEWKSPEKNRESIGALILKAPASDLFVLPEMFTTGFITDPEGIAEEGGKTLEWMKQLASACNAAVMGSIAGEEDGKYYNRLYFVKPDGSWQKYDKRHLFSFAGEDREYTAGQERVVVEYMGFRIMLQVCYDLRFPVFSRNRGDYDVLVYVANWPESRIRVWETLLKARAIENQCYVLGVNRVGSDPDAGYCGSSAVIDFKGEVIRHAESGREEILEAVLDMEKLERFREKFPAWRDSDKFEIKI